MEMKILLATLVHNTPDLAENMLEQWNRDSEFINKHCDIMIVDNGSDSNKISKVTTHRLEQNVFFGGGCNVIMDYFLSNNYDYLLMFNSDIIFHGYKFLSTAFDGIFLVATLVSPSKKSLPLTMSLLQLYPLLQLDHLHLFQHLANSPGHPQVFGRLLF